MTMPTRQCPECLGSGRYEVQVAADEWSDRGPCEECGGRGEIDVLECTACGSIGELENCGFDEWLCAECVWRRFKQRAR
jgi:DnaJ-class molecular chaperone